MPVVAAGHTGPALQEMGEFSVAVRRGRRPRRAAGPLCAGLLFGGPAGLIAGAIGGLGLHMARKMSASMDYRYDQGENRLVIGFDLEG